MIEYRCQWIPNAPTFEGLKFIQRPSVDPLIMPDLVPEILLYGITRLILAFPIRRLLHYTKIQQAQSP